MKQGHENFDVWDIRDLNHLALDVFAKEPAFFSHDGDPGPSNQAGPLVPEFSVSAVDSTNPTSLSADSFHFFDESNRFYSAFDPFELSYAGFDPSELLASTETAKNHLTAAATNIMIGPTLSSHPPQKGQTGNTDHSVDTDCRGNAADSSRLPFYPCERVLSFYARCCCSERR